MPVDRITITVFAHILHVPNPLRTENLDKSIILIRYIGKRWCRCAATVNYFDSDVHKTDLVSTSLYLLHQNDAINMP